MADYSQSTSDLTSSYSKMFLEKMALLNRTFLEVLQGHIREVPDVDLSPTIRDYLAHVQNLDRIYGSRDSETTPNEPSAFAFGSNTNGTAQRTASLEGTTDSSVKPLATKPSDSSSCKAGSSLNSAPKFSFGCSNTNESNKDAVENERRGKKRAKRGGPDEREDEVIISYQGPKVTPSSGDSAMPTTGFSFGKQSEDEKKPSSEGLVPAKPLFTFGTASKESPKLGADSTDLASSKKEDTKESTKGESSSPFGQTQKLPTATSGFTFGSDSAVSKSAAAPLFTFGKTISKESGTGSGDQATAAFKTPTFPSVSSLPGAGGKDAKPLFSFGSSAKDSSSTDKGFKFGQSSVTTVTNGNDGSDNKDGENEEEYVPPKVEAVLEDEPDAILSTKCSVFVLKGKTYEKLGVGQLHIKKKEGESRKILLIRAATTIGTIWLNAFIDKNMKCAKADEVKLRVNCVSEGHPSTHLIRLPSAKDRERVENELSHSGNDS